MRVTFFVPNISDADELATLDPDHDWRALRIGREWTLQTYLRLRNSGYPVELSSTLPSDGVLVFHVRQKAFLKCEARITKNIILVGIRGDCRCSMMADFEILQNGCWADEKTQFFIPLWPQQDIVQRKSERGNRVETISFKGFDVNVHPYYHSKDWLSWIKQNGITWKHDSMPHELAKEFDIQVNWNDYSDIDAVVAFRPPPDRNKMLAPGYTNKPATKLYNAWMAGTPAVLAQEYAFREQRRSPLDYIEIEKPEDAKEAILKLKKNPELYQAMVKNGQKRAKEFTVEKITERWAEVLFGLIPRQANTLRMKTLRYCPLKAKIQLHKLLHRLAGKPKW